MSERLEYTFEERRLLSICDVDVYIAAGVSTEMDCSVLGYPPAGPVCPNSLGLDVLCIDAMTAINTLLAQGKKEEALRFIREGKEKIKAEEI